jgi:Predicted Zn-dependent hydrolases of the beta-lactamase fold
MEVIYHGHSCIEVVFSDGQRLIVDPFLADNPLADVAPEEVKVDWIVITHGHNDHIGDMAAIAKANDATIISVAEITDFAKSLGLKGHGMNIGGKHTFPFGVLKLVHAQHSSSYEYQGQTLYMGEPSGFLLMAEGKTLYHAGDTSAFGDMALFGEAYDIDVAFLPIGDNFTMGPEEAARAAKRLKAKQVVPIHYNTFPVIQQDPHAFAALLPAGQGQVMAPGERLTLN